jgi:hypothetical protein
MVQAAALLRRTTHLSRSQKNPLWQSVCLVQVEAHELPVQMPGAQLRDDAGVLQTPLPLQVEAAYSTAASQRPGAHSVPAA